MPSIPVIVSMLAAAIASFSRVFDATRPAWGRLPAWAQTLAPTLLAALGFVAAGLAHVTTGTDLTVVLVAGIMVLLPGLPSNRSAAPLQAGKPVTGSPSLGDVAVANALRVGSVSPPPPNRPSVPPVAGMLLAICIGLLSLTGCAWFKGSVEPKVAACAPSPATLVSEVATILAGGGDYVAALEQAGLIEGKEAIRCAVLAFLSSMGGPADDVAKARGRDFLAKEAAK